MATVEFEQACEDAEGAAQAAERAAKDVLKAAKQMEKAAQTGDVKKLRKSAASIRAAIEVARQAAMNAGSAWPFSEEQEQQYLEREYNAEFLATAKRAGLTVHARDQRLIAFPSIVRILPSDLGVSIDRKKVYAIRPSHLVSVLLKRQTSRARSKSEQFLESLYAAYKLLVPKNELGKVIKLVDVYRAFTLQPGAASEYDRSEFARDLYMLDRSRLRHTRSRATVSLPAAPSARGAERDRISFVAEDGEPLTYYGLSFTEAKA